MYNHAKDDPRHVSLRGEFETKKQLSDAVKLVALEQGKSMMVNQKKKGSKSVVLGCTDTLAKGANGNCSASVSGTKLKSGLWSVPRKSYNMDHINCNGKPKVSAKMLASSNAMKIAVGANGKISAKAKPCMYMFWVMLKLSRITE